jgi:hypothetical protein
VSCHIGDCHVARRTRQSQHRRCVMLNRIKAMWARLWRRRRPTSEREFHDQREASRYRSEAEARGHWNPPGGDSM